MRTLRKRAGAPSARTAWQDCSGTITSHLTDVNEARLGTVRDDREPSIRVVPRSAASRCGRQRNGAPGRLAGDGEDGQVEQDRSGHPAAALHA
jgi:hypothetical protein